MRDYKSNNPGPQRLRLKEWTPATDIEVSGELVMPVGLLKAWKRKE